MQGEVTLIFDLFILIMFIVLNQKEIQVSEIFKTRNIN